MQEETSFCSQQKCLNEGHISNLFFCYQKSDKTLYSHSSQKHPSLSHIRRLFTVSPSKTAPHPTQTQPRRKTDHLLKVGQETRDHNLIAIQSLRKRKKNIFFTNMNRIYFTFKTWSWCYTTVLFIKTQDACFFSEMHVCVCGCDSAQLCPFSSFQGSITQKTKRQTNTYATSLLAGTLLVWFFTYTHTHTRQRWTAKQEARRALKA